VNLPKDEYNTRLETEQLMASTDSKAFDVAKSYMNLSDEKSELKSPVTKRTQSTSIQTH
jgi:hypothetical protein